MEDQRGRAFPRRLQDRRLFAFSDDDESVRSAVLARRARELWNSFVELEAADVQVVVARRTRLARRIRIGREGRDVDDGSPEVRGDHASQEIARRDCDGEGVEGLETIGPVAPQLRRLPGARQAGEARGLFAERSEERRVGKECRSRWSPY